MSVACIHGHGFACSKLGEAARRRGGAVKGLRCGTVEEPPVIESCIESFQRSALLLIRSPLSSVAKAVEMAQPRLASGELEACASRSLPLFASSSLLLEAAGCTRAHSQHLHYSPHSP